MSLILPKRLTQSTQPNSPPVKMGVYLTLAQLIGNSTGIPDLITALSKLKRSDVIRWIAAISMQLAKPESLTQERQLEMARQLLPHEIMIGLKNWLQKGEQFNWALFHRRQMWFLLQLACVACKEDASAIDDQELMKTIGHIGLMVNDVLHKIEPKQDSDDWKADYNYCFASSVIPLLEHACQMEVTARAYTFWFELSKSSTILQQFAKLKVLPFASAFEGKYGLSLERFYLIAFCSWCGFQVQAHSSNSPLLQDCDQYLVPSFGVNDATLAMSLLSQTPDQLSYDLLGKPRQNWAVDSSFLKSKPVIEVYPGKYACPDIDNLHRYLTDGIYFLLQNAYSGDQFRQLFGYLFEEYLHNLFSQFGVESDTLTRTFWRSPKFIGTTDEACDGLLQQDEIALVMEYKARLLTTREKYAGIPEVTWKGIEDILAKNKSVGKKGTFQLAGNIRRIIDGEMVSSGRSTYSLAGNVTIFPALVTYEDAMGLGAIRQWADNKLRSELSKQGVDLTRVGPLLILTTHDIERLEALTHKDKWVEIIRGYSRYIQDNPDHPMATLDIYLAKSNFRTEDSGTSFIAKAHASANKFVEEKMTVLPISQPTNTVMPNSVT